MPEAADLRVVGLAQGDPNVPRTSSGAAMYLLDALERRCRVVARASTELTPWQRRALAAVTFRPDREQWTSRFYWWRGLALELRSRNSARVLAGVDEPFDVVLQFFGLFQTRGAPYCMYVDNTIDMSRRLWPDWVPVQGAPLERLLAYERRLFGEAAHVFTMGRPQAESLRSFYGVPAERVTVVGGGLNFAELPPPAPAGEHEPAILFVGREWRRKGGDVLIEAFRRIRAERPEVKLTIVGTDEAPRDVDGVEVLGPIADRDRLARLYAAARVFCVPSRYEPFGLVYVEAMAHGLPVVAADVGAVSEAVVDGETGALVPPGDAGALAAALLRILADPEHAARLGAAGRERVARELTWDAVAGRMLPALTAVAHRS